MKTKVLALSSAFMFLCGLNQQANALPEGLSGGVRLGAHTTFMGAGEYLKGDVTFKDKDDADQKIKIKDVSHNKMNFGGEADVWVGYRLYESEGGTCAMGLFELGALRISSMATGKIDEKKAAVGAGAAAGAGNDDKKGKDVSAGITMSSVKLALGAALEQDMGDIGSARAELLVGGIFPMLGAKRYFKGEQGTTKHDINKDVKEGMANSLYSRFSLGYTDPTKILSIMLDFKYIHNSLGAKDDKKAEALKRELLLKNDASLPSVSAGISAKFNVLSLIG